MMGEKKQKKTLKLACQQLFHGHRNVRLLRMRRRPHSLLFIKVDQGVVYPIRLSGIFSYLAWLKNKGVRIIEVLLLDDVDEQLMSLAKLKSCPQRDTSLMCAY